MNHPIMSFLVVVTPRGTINAREEGVVEVGMGEMLFSGTKSSLP